MNDTAPMVQMIPIDQINVLNPRSRNKVVFQSIVSNISNLGLKRPITVARRTEPADGKFYDLVCGQGRLEAFAALGQAEIPAIVKEASKEECFLMSLVENIARRQIRPLELLREISSLKSRGYSTTEIANKIDVHKSYVTGISHLLKDGEERLISAVETGRIPLSVAMQIANTDEDGIQRALCQAYEDKTLRGPQATGCPTHHRSCGKPMARRSNPGVRRKVDRPAIGRGAGSRLSPRGRPAKAADKKVTTYGASSAAYRIRAKESLPGRKLRHVAACGGIGHNSSALGRKNSDHGQGFNMTKQVPACV